MERVEVLRQWYKNNKTDKKSARIEDLMSKDLTICHNPIKKGKINHTLFDEIGVMNYNDVFDTKELDKPLNRKNISRKEFIIKYIDLFRQSIYENWDPSKMHIILHSSGFDSRILSGILLRLYNELGDSWMGKSVLLCYTPEEDYAERVINYYNVDIDFYKYNVAEKQEWTDFKNGWKCANGASLYPQNRVYLSTEYLRNIYNFKECQIFSAGYHNEIFDKGYFNKNISIKKFLQSYYIHHYSLFTSAVNGDIIYPILNPKILRLIAESGVTLNKKLRLDILKSIDSKLYSFPRMPDKEARLSKNIDEELRKKIYNDYKNSLYFKKFKKLDINPPSVIAYNKFWYYWSSASCYEKLFGEL